jgi:hypothetical protein
MITLTSLAMSMTVYTFVTSLIVFTIFKVFQKVKPTLDEKFLGAMALFSVRLARLSWLTFCHRFHDDKSMAEAAASLRFAPVNPKSFCLEIHRTRQIYTIIEAPRMC